MQASGKTLGKDRGGEHWLVLILILSEKKKTAGMIGELGGYHHSPSQSPHCGFPVLGERKRPKGSDWRLDVKK